MITEHPLFKKIKKDCELIVDDGNAANELIEDIPGDGEWDQDILDNYEDNNRNIELAYQILKLINKE
jgi:hypothetical protein